jgi:predicted P-loop ATPase
MKMGYKKESKMKQIIVKIENDDSRSGQTLEISVTNKKSAIT